MKPIEIPFRYNLKAPIKKQGTKISLPIGKMKIHEKIRERGQGIARSCTDIEDWIKELIAKIAFSNENKHIEFLQGLILDSDFCTFSVKRTILNKCLGHFKYLSGKKRAALEKYLADVIKYRNAFTHGKIINKDDKFYIKYFEGNIQSDELNNDYWDKLILTLDKTFELLRELEDLLDKSK
jgi:hypothetical protein